MNPNMCRGIFRGKTEFSMSLFINKGWERGGSDLDQKTVAMSIVFNYPNNSSVFRRNGRVGGWGIRAFNRVWVKMFHPPPSDWVFKTF